MNKKKIFVLLTLVLLATLTVACGEEPDVEAKDKEKSYLSIATGGTSGTYYPLGEALAKIYNSNIDGVDVTVQSTGASVENIGLISKGDAEIGFTQSDITYYASEGIENFKDEGAVENLKGMAMFYPEVIQIIVNTSSGIESVEDLKGKKVAIGAVGSGTEANARQILGAHGMDYNDLEKADYLSFGEAGEQLKDNQIDAAFVTAGIPTEAVTEISKTSYISVISLDSRKINELSHKYPFYTEVTIPSESYDKQDEDITTIAVMAMLVVSEDLEEDLVYDLTKQLFENKESIIDTHDRGNDLNLKTAKECMPIDLHPGSKRYYDEEGIK